ncbi:MAG: RNA polymerase sigma factor FliA [Steroidobacteraceae bacterium]|jgi:RNA polymerase sigma factor for flagellar operon FliA
MNAINAYHTHAVESLDGDTLVKRHAELVRRIAFHLVAKLPPSVEVDDLIQAGMMGLLEAASQYSADRGASFETFAGIRIRGAMLDSLRAMDWTPRSVHRKARDLAKAIREVEHETGGEASPVMVARHMGISLDEYHQIVQDAASSQLSSLDELESDEPVGAELDPLRTVTDVKFKQALIATIDGLPEREKLVMSLYYQDGLNLKEIGLVLGVTESRVSQLHGQAISRLKARLVGWREMRS